MDFVFGKIRKVVEHNSEVLYAGISESNIKHGDSRL